MGALSGKWRIIIIYPEGNLKVCTKLHGNPCNSFQEISFRTANVNIGAESGYHQSFGFIFWGPWESVQSFVLSFWTQLSTALTAAWKHPIHLSSVRQCCMRARHWCVTGCYITPAEQKSPSLHSRDWFRHTDCTIHSQGLGGGGEGEGEQGRGNLGKQRVMCK